LQDNDCIRARGAYNTKFGTSESSEALHSIKTSKVLDAKRYRDIKNYYRPIVLKQLLNIINPVENMWVPTGFQT